MGGWLAAEMTPHLSAPGVNMPVLMIQVLRDSWTRNPEDAQKTFDLLGSKEKELFWIEGTTRPAQRMQHVEMLSGPRARDVKQPALLLNLISVAGGHVAGKNSVGDMDYVHPHPIRILWPNGWCLR